MKLTKKSSIIFILCILTTELALAQSNNEKLFDYYLSKPLVINQHSAYSRIKLKIESNSNYKEQTKFLNILSKYLLFSGVFDTQLNYQSEFPDLLLKIENGQPSGLSLSFLIPDTEKSIYEASIDVDPRSNILEKNIIDFIDEAILSIDGEKSLFGSAILYSQNNRLKTSSDIILTDFLGKSRYILVRDGLINILPVWSHSGTKFLYTAVGPTGIQVRLFDFESFTITALNDFGTATGGSFSADDKSAIFTLSYAGSITLYEYNFATRKMSKLINTPYIATNGVLHEDKLLFTSNSSSGVQIFFKNNYEKNVRPYRMTYLGTHNSEPRWSNSGDVFLYTSYQSGIFQLFLMHPKSDSIRQITFDKYDSVQGVWSSDDRQILFSEKLKNRHSGLSIITVDGKFKRFLDTRSSLYSATGPSWTNSFDWSLLSN